MTQPNCATCGQPDKVSIEFMPDYLFHGSHFCGDCEDWFTPVNANAKQADEALDSFEKRSQDIQALHNWKLPKVNATLDPFEFLFKPFIKALQEIGKYGAEKYGDKAIAFHIQNGTKTPRTERTKSEAISNHAAQHFEDYLEGEIHDHFGTRGHQLAAVAFNAMMEYYFLTKESY